MNAASIINAVKGNVNLGTAKKLVLLGSGFAKKNAPQLLTGTSIIALGGAVVATAKSAIAIHGLFEDREFMKYSDLIEKHGEDYKPEPEELKIPIEEKLMLSWKHLILPTALTVTSAACMIASTSIHADRYATALAMLTLAETDNKVLKAKMEELLGKDTVQNIKEAIFEDKLNGETEDGEKNDYKKASEKEQSVIISGSQKVQFMDDFGNEWHSTIPFVEKAIEEINNQFINEQFPCVSVNEFVCMAGGNPGIDKFSIAGDAFGWPSDVVDDNYPYRTDDGPIDIKLAPFIDTSTKNVVVHVQYLTEPYAHYFEY